jgi:hypothetical protein
MGEEVVGRIVDEVVVGGVGGFHPAGGEIEG